MESRAYPTMIQRYWTILDGRFAQAGMIIGAFATAAVLAALYGPGPRAAIATQPSLVPAAIAAPLATVETVADDTDSQIDEAAREAARRKIADIINRQAADAAAGASLTSAPAAAAPPAGPLAQPASNNAPPPAANISNEDFEKLADRAAAAIHTGDIAGARLLLEHAVAAGDKTAIYALAETYDPRVLAQLHVRGMTGDANKAQSLYQEALAQGVTKAQAKLISSDK